MDAIEILNRYNRFKSLVKTMLDAQQDYFKRGKDIQKLRKSKAIEKEVRDIVDPKPVDNQGMLEFLGR